MIDGSKPTISTDFPLVGLDAGSVGGGVVFIFLMFSVQWVKNGER